MSLFSKFKQAAELALDSYISKSAPPFENQGYEQEDAKRKAYIALDGPFNQEGLFKERTTFAGPGVLKNMARRDSLVIAIHQAIVNQISNFTQRQRDKYSPGFRFVARVPADLTREEKLSLSDPNLDEDAFNQLKFELEQKKAKLQEQQDEDIDKLTEFLLHGGKSKKETDTTYRRFDFDKFIKLITRDRLTYNYVAVELIPTRDYSKVAGFYPVSAGTIRYVAARSRKHYEETVSPLLKDTLGYQKDGAEKKDKPYRYVQVIQGRPVAAFTEDELIFEPGNPTVDPEDYGYGQGELEWLVTIITSHLYAEAHNRNFFTQGVGTKGILHIKGDNISRAQLEGFKRQWFNQLSNARNSFRPPIIGMADEVRWIALTQSNREMEFTEWMNYLIKVACAIYQIDPAEINFDITRTETSTLNEGSSEHRFRSSKNKGVRPLLTYLENIINHQVLPRWNSDLAEKYYFEFAGLDAETRMQEVDRLEKEGQVYKTINEIRTEQGMSPLEDGDILLNAAYTQYKQMQVQAEQAKELSPEMGGEQPQEAQTDHEEDHSDIEQDLDDISAELEKEVPDEKAEDTKKSVTIEYHHFPKEKLTHES